jgi:glycosyltransferase involved in cell wall biosynthesis
MTDTYSGWLRKHLTKIVVRNAAAVLPVTINLQRAMESYGLLNPNYRIIPNVVDIKVFQPSEKALPKDKAIMVHVSCFEDKQKNISGLLRVFDRLSKIRQDWHANLVGDGIHFEKLKKYGEELKLNGTFVTFHGLKEGNDLVKLIQNAHFQVLFSRFENLPVVILEGYACGIPILSTDVGGISEHLDDSLGKLIQSEDEEALLNSLIEMIDKRDSYDRKNIRNYALDHFSKEVIGKQLYGVYKGIVTR